MKFPLTLLLLLVFNALIAQIKIIGTVNNNKGQPIEGANVILSPSNTDSTLAYFVTKADGKFLLELKETIHQMYEVKVYTMNYAFASDLVNESTSDFNITLEDKVIELKELNIKKSPISKKGDTINYDVSNFKDIQDRTIADVIRKMPGIEIESSGRILYQGEPINKYYIEGMDLLSGKYALANENLSADAVDKVQILENHQPIKILDSLVVSSRAALNIKLKNKITYSGKAEIGLGLSPLLYQVNVTPMLFKKKQQMIGSYQSNNRGEDSSKQLKTLSLEDLIKNNEIFSNETWLNILEVQTPNFTEKRWLDNSLQLGTWNHLFKLNKEFDLRVNLSYINDYQKRIGESTTKYFLPTENIFLKELKKNHIQTEEFLSKLTLLRNSSNNYFQNEIEIKENRNRYHGYLTRDNELYNQILKKPNKEFSNNFKIIRKIGKQLISFNSLVSYKDYQEQLSITPGVFKEIINDKNTYQEALQIIDFNKIKFNNFIELTKGIKKFSIHSKLGFGYLSQTMKSNLFVDKESKENDFENNLNWTNFNYYLENRIEYKKGNLRSTLNIPIEINHLKLNSIDKEDRINKVFIKPNLFTSYKISSYLDLNLTNNYKQEFGNLAKIHSNYVLYNYNSIQKRDGKLNKSDVFNSSLRLEYKDPIKSLFSNFSYSYSWNENTLLNNYIYNSNGSTILQVIDRINHQVSHSLNGGLNKYISKLKSNIEINFNKEWKKNEEYLNNDFVEVNNQLTSLTGGINFRKLSWVFLEYQYTWSNYKSKLDNNSSRKVINQEHKFSFYFFPAERHYIKINVDAYVNKDTNLNPNSIFGDLMYRYTFKKRKIDLELSAFNLFNEKVFSQNSLNSYYEINYQYKLRPTQIMITTRFSF